MLQQSAVAGRVAVGLEEVRRARARRAVHEALESADLHPGVPRPAPPHAVRDRLPRVERQVDGHAQREPAGPLEPTVAREIFPRGGHVARRGHAECGGVRQRAGERRVAPLGRRRRDGVADQTERAVLEDPDRVAGPRVTQDLPPDGRGRGARDARRAHRRGVGERLVPVQSIHEHGIMGCDRVDPVVPRQWLAGPERMVPVPAQNPLTRRPGERELLEAANELLGRRRVAEVHGGELKPTIDKVGVGVGEAGGDETAGRGHDRGIGADVARHVARVSDREDLAPRDRDRTRARHAARQSSPDRAPRDDEVGPRPAASEGEAQEC